MPRCLKSARRAAAFAASLCLAIDLWAYNVSGQRWAGASVVMNLQLGPSPGALLDGSASWGASAEDALALWSGSLTNLKFSVVRDSTAPIGRGNGTNNVFWSATVYGDAWDSRTLAITLSNYDTRTHFFSEGDVLFNNTLNWNSYRGALKSVTGGGTLYDFHRVALHEFGHVLGLNHPDDIGQTVAAVMNSATSNTDALQTDDIAGARAIYDAPGAVVAAVLNFNGSISYQTAGSTLTLRAAGVQNVGNASSGTLRLELWAMPQHFTNGLPSGSKNLGTYAFSSVLPAGSSFSNVSGNTTYTAPPNGTYYVVMLLTEFTGGSGSGYTIRDSIEFTNPLVIGNGINAPAVAAQPLSQNFAAGSPATLTVAVTGTAPSFQWFKNGVLIPGATGATLTFASVQLTDAGSYTVTITNASGSVTSATATLTITSTQGTTTARITNLSILTSLTSATDNFTLGYVVGNASSANPLSLVLRAAGPALGALSYPGTMADPKLETYAGSTKTGENDNWGGTAALKAAFASVGAFSYASEASKDAATLAGITTRDNSVKISSADGGTGAVIAEVYDATPSANFNAGSPRLINVSVLKPIGSSLTVGFVIGGTGTKTVLIRALGPTLATLFGFSTSSIIVDPKLELFNGASASIATNDNWSGTTALSAAFSAAGTFALDPASKDAALVATVSPGNYTVVVTPASGATGTGLVEVYELP